MEFREPILFLIYNRPEVSYQVFQRIAEMRPTHLFVAADGPNNGKPDDQLKCIKTRSIVTDNITWDCKVEYLFRDTNLGCKQAVSEALTWFFGHVEQGIILEDDCLPSRSFFYYCQDLLHKFRDDTRIFSINGCNFGYEGVNNDGIGYSKFMNMWGWASWRRSARLVDYRMDDWKKKNKIAKYAFLIKKLHNNPSMPFDWGWVMHWREKFDDLSKEKINTWDYQWIYTGLRNNMVSIYPVKNQVENIGFDLQGTHTVYTSKVEFPKAHEIGRIRLEANPPIEVNRYFEKEYVKKVWSFHTFQPLSFHIKNYILKALGKY